MIVFQRNCVEYSDSDSDSDHDFVYAMRKALSQIRPFSSKDLLEVIINSFNKLTHIQFTSDVFLVKEVQKILFDNFGHKLISLRIERPYICLTSSRLKATNIEELIVCEFDSQLSQMKFNRLKRFKVTRLWDKDLDSFEVFIENNTKTLKHLDINYLGIIGKPEEKTSANHYESNKFGSFGY